MMNTSGVMIEGEHDGVLENVDHVLNNLSLMEGDSLMQIIYQELDRIGMLQTIESLEEESGIKCKFLRDSVFENERFEGGFQRISVPIGVR